MKENFLSCTTFPFAFNPENPLSRSAKWINEKTLVMSFDMTIMSSPECAAVALILSNNKTRKIKFKVHSKGDMKPSIFVELKSGESKTKYFESLIEEKKDIELNLNSNTSEIVFTCWKNANKGFKGEIIVSFE